MLKLPDLVHETSTTTGTGALALGGAVTGKRALGSVLSNNDVAPYSIRHQSANEWEVGIGTYASGGNTLTRTTILASSNSGNAVNFSAGTKDVQIVMPGRAAAGGALDIAYSATIAFQASGVMPTQYVSGAIAFGVDTTGAMDGVSVTVHLVADGSHAPTFSTPLRELGNSAGYDNTSGIRNVITFWRSAGEYWYSIQQAVDGASEGPPAAPSFSTAPSIVGTPAVGVPSSYVSGSYTGSPTPTITQQWTLDGVDISGATGATYTPVSGDIGHALRVREIATNTGGSANSTSASKTVTSGGGYAVVAHTSGVHTSAAVNTTGADLIIVACAADPSRTVSDSNGNTWTGLTASQSGGPGVSTMKLFYCKNPTVGSGHTFTESSGFGAVLVLAMSGSAATPFDVESGAATASATSLAAGSVTPSQNNCLVVSALTYGPTLASPTVSTGLTIIESVAGVAGVNYGGSLAYEIQTTATARNPTWSWSSGAEEAATRAAVFK